MFSTEVLVLVQLYSQYTENSDPTAYTIKNNGPIAYTSKYSHNTEE